MGVTLDTSPPMILKGVETREDEITSHQADSLGMKAEWEPQLRAFLNAVTEGDAFATVRSSEKLPPIEIWRLLADNGDPITEGRQMDDLEQLLGWPRCKDLSKLRAYAQQWEDAVLEYENKSGEKFPTSYWRVGRTTSGRW